MRRQDKEYKQLRSYIDRIDTFAKGFGLTGGQEIYDMETFKQISSPYFGLHVKPRVEAFFESVGSSENASCELQKYECILRSGVKIVFYQIQNCQ